MPKSVPKVQYINWVFDPIIALLGPVCVGDPNAHIRTSSAACEPKLWYLPGLWLSVMSSLSKRGW